MAKKGMSSTLFIKDGILIKYKTRAQMCSYACPKYLKKNKLYTYVKTNDLKMVASLL